MFELSPALFISGAARIHGLDIHNANVTGRMHQPPVWRLVLLADGAWHKKPDIDLVCNLTTLASGAEYHWYVMKQSRKTSGTPTLPAVCAILGRKITCVLPLPVFLSRHGWAPVRNHSVYSASDKVYYPDKEFFCSWTPWGGYDVPRHRSRVHDTTFLTLSPGGDCSSYRDLCGKKRATVVQVAAEVDMGHLENPVAGVTIVTNEHGKTLRYRQDEKWVCDSCTSFCVGPTGTRVVAAHGNGPSTCKNDKSPTMQ